MANRVEAHHDVLATVVDIESTENVRVHEDLIDVARALPPAMAATLVSRVEDWFAGPYSLTLGLPERIADLVVHLVSGGQKTEAMRLARTLLDLRPDEEGDQARRDARVRYPPWRYGRLIEAVRGPLLTVSGIDVLGLFCDLLDRSIRGDARSLDLAGARDLSHAWHAELDRDPQIDGRGVLVTAVRDTARSLVQAAPATFDDVLACLESHAPGVFTRLALDLLGVDGALRPDLIERWLADPRLVWVWGPHREYRMLLAARFGTISEATRQQILDQLDGPAPKPMEEDQAERWRLAVLSAIGDALPTEWRARLDDLAARFDVALRADDVPFRAEVMAGDPAPLTEEQVSGMEISALVTYLRGWAPTRGWAQPTPVGMGHSLRAAVKTDPARYAADAEDFKGLDPTYVRSFTDGIGLALKDRAVFEWGSVLELCRWAVDQPRESEPRQRDDWDRDPGWRDARQRIASLLDDGMGSETNPIPWELREPLWRVLQRLTDDPDPLPRSIDDDSHMDPATAAINSVRGEAMLAAIRYGLWVRGGLVKNAGRSPEDVGFEDMPELREVLDHHVEPSRDPALPIRAVFGWRFDALVALDRAWVRDHMDDIFPQVAELDVPADAAWCAFVVFNHPRRWTFDLLEPQYRRAIVRAGRARAGRTWAADPDLRLADHVIACCWSGWADDELVDSFFSAASDAVRARAFRTAGEALQGTTEDVPDVILQRLVRCWERRWAATSVTPREHVEERAAFGWLFAFGRFDEDWALSNLLRVVESVGKVEPVEEVLAALGRLTTRRPRDVATALRGMVEGEQEPWMPYVHREVMREILDALLAGGDARAADLAREVVNRLAARGHHEFRDLLSRQR